MNFIAENIRGIYDCPSEMDLRNQQQQQIDQLLAIRKRLIRSPEAPDSEEDAPLGEHDDLLKPEFMNRTVDKTMRSAM